MDWISRIKENPRELKDAPPEFKDNDDIVREAINNTPLVLLYASERLQHDKKLIMTLLDKNIDIGQFIGNKELKDMEIAIKILKINQSNINYLILAHRITPEFINICESIYPYIFNRIKSEYLFRLTNLPNSTDNIARILFRAPNQLVFDFFEFDSCVTMGENIRNILKKYEYFIQYAPQFKQFILD